MLIFLDLDGTVIGSNGVSQAVDEAVDAARDAGLTLCVCTGRPRLGVAQRIASRFGDGPHIFESGAMIAGPMGPPVAVHPLNPDHAMALAKHAASCDAVLEFYTPTGVFASQLNDDCREHAEVIGIDVSAADLRDIAQTHAVLRAHWIMRAHNRSEALALRLEGIETGEASSPVLPGFLFASLTSWGVSKGTAAAHVARLRGVAMSDVWAVGDAEGDRPILEVVGYPRVMGNAPASLKADFPVIAGVDDDGVARLLQELMR